MLVFRAMPALVVWRRSNELMTRFGRARSPRLGSSESRSPKPSNASKIQRILRTSINSGV